MPETESSRYLAASPALAFPSIVHKFYQFTSGHRLITPIWAIVVFGGKTNKELWDFQMMVWQKTAQLLSQALES